MSAVVVTDGTVVCPVDAIPRGGGVAALVDGVQVAVFRTDDGDLHAVDNHDPCSGANVLSRGIVGVHGGRTTVASPLRKQRFDLVTGECLDVAGMKVTVHDIAVDDGRVMVRLAPNQAGPPVAGDDRDTQV